MMDYISQTLELKRKIKNNNMKIIKINQINLILKEILCLKFKNYINKLQYKLFNF